MSERHTEVRTFLAEMECDECQKGDMKPFGFVLTTDPSLYQHRCENCGNVRNYQEKYPKVFYRII